MVFSIKRRPYSKKEKEASYVRKEAAELVCALACTFSLSYRARAVGAGTCCSYTARFPSGSRWAGSNHASSQGNRVTTAHTADQRTDPPGQYLTRRTGLQ